MSEQQTPSNITARFSIDLTDKDDPIVAARTKVDGRETKVPVYLVIGGLVVTEGLADPQVRAAYANILFKASQDLALSLLKEAGTVQEQGPPSDEPPVKTNLTA